MITDIELLSDFGFLDLSRTAAGGVTCIWDFVIDMTAGEKAQSEYGNPDGPERAEKTLLLSYHDGSKSIGALVQFTREILEHILVSKLVWVTSPLAAKFLAYLSCII